MIRQVALIEYEVVELVEVKITSMGITHIYF